MVEGRGPPPRPPPQNLTPIYRLFGCIPVNGRGLLIEQNRDLTFDFVFMQTKTKTRTKTKTKSEKLHN